MCKKDDVFTMGRISVTLSDDLEKKLRFKTIERFGGKKGDRSRPNMGRQQRRLKLAFFLFQ
jgi:hypothetical protein